VTSWKIQLESKRAPSPAARGPRIWRHGDETTNSTFNERCRFMRGEESTLWVEFRTAR